MDDWGDETQLGVLDGVKETCLGGHDYASNQRKGLQQRGGEGHQEKPRGPDGRNREGITEDENGPTFETLLDTLGHFGRFQVLIFSLLTATDIMNATIMMYLVFGPATPRWRCAEFEGHNTTDVLNKTLQNETFVKTCNFNRSRCVRFDFGTDYTSIVTEWNLVCDKKYITKLTSSTLMLGVLIGSLGASQLADLYGRQKILRVSICLLLFLQTMVGFSNNWQMYTALRFSTGIFLGATMCIAYILPMEYIGPKWRSTCGAFGIWDLGCSLSALAAYLLCDWRHLAFFSGSAFVPLAIAILILVPESIRWLIQKQRFEEARTIIRHMAAVNRKPVPDLSLLERISKVQNEEKERETQYTYLDLFSTKTLAARTLAVTFCLFSVSCLYYAIVVSIPDLSGSLYLNTVYSSLPGVFLGWTVIPMANLLGRKRAYFLYVCLPIIAVFGIVILHATGQIQQQATTRTVLAIIGKITVGEAWTVTLLITSEIYPTLMRSVGIGIGDAASRVGGVIAPQIVLVGDVVHWTFPYIINGCLVGITVILVVIVFPETKGNPLREDAPPAGSCLRKICNCARNGLQKKTSTKGVAISVRVPDVYRKGARSVVDN